MWPFYFKTEVEWEKRKKTNGSSDIPCQNNKLLSKLGPNS